jgi:ATP-dependent Clp protease adapter protein ClpS
MVILGFLFGSLIVGGLLYLPFFLWFRYRKPTQGRFSEPLRLTRTGYVALAAQLGLIFGGLALGMLYPDSALATLVHGDTGALKWWICVTIVVSAISLLAKRAGLLLEPPPPEDAQAADKKEDSTARARGFKLIDIGGVPIYVQRSFLLGGAFLALMVGANAGIEGAVGYCIAYAGLIALHELGHAVAARTLGLRVHSVELSRVGGLCRVQLPRSLRDTLVVYSAGLAAQGLVLSLALATLAILGPPTSRFGTAVVTTLTWVNLLVFLVNLLPGRTPSGLMTDGSILWGLYRHVSRNEPHPLAAQHAASPVFDPATFLLTIEGLRPAGFAHGIEVLNDDTTPMEFVIQVLQSHAGLNQDAAIAATVQIHLRGGLLLQLADRASAEAVANAIALDARTSGHRLVCRAASAGPEASAAGSNGIDR